MILPDLLADGLDLVLCGTAPSLASKAAAAYYAHPGNLFWATLHQVGLTPERLAPIEYPRLLGFGIGLTDLNKSEWGADSELSRAGFDVAGFAAKIARHRPGLVAFTSKHAARIGLERREIAYGPQQATIGGRPAFVLPSTSGRARGHFDPEPWRDLARLLGRAG
jgi:TDG/mug DNA glycosylase family protein